MNTRLKSGAFEAEPKMLDRADFIALHDLACAFLKSRRIEPSVSNRRELIRLAMQYQGEWTYDDVWAFVELNVPRSRR